MAEAHQQGDWSCCPVLHTCPQQSSPAGVVGCELACMMPCSVRLFFSQSTILHCCPAYCRCKSLFHKLLSGYCSIIKCVSLARTPFHTQECRARDCKHLKDELLLQHEWMIVQGCSWWKVNQLRQMLINLHKLPLCGIVESQESSQYKSTPTGRC